MEQVMAISLKESNKCIKTMISQSQENKFNPAKSSLNRIINASPLKRLGFRSARSFRCAPFPRLTPAQFASPANLRFAYPGCQTVIYNRALCDNL
jgi:hypothetical protein